MAFQMEIHYEGKVHKGKVTDEVTAKEAKTAVYELLADMNKLEMELEQGGFLLMGRDAVKRATMLFLER